MTKEKELFPTGRYPDEDDLNHFNHCDGCCDCDNLMNFYSYCYSCNILIHKKYLIYNRLNGNYYCECCNSKR